ncbi:MAG: twin-arginine translocation pathway signal protein [Hyphomicrobiales bacterium]|nr:MAG: twin-arginine translocation pathway signal protein [Hyphomicrobiales bacterium]
MNRRDLLKTASLGALAGTFAATAAHAEKKMMMPWEWTDKHGLVNKLPKDTAPLENEFEKYPRCPYCGMARKMWHTTRHLVVYEDDAVDGTCSLHCAAISLSLNMDRGPKTIYAGDAGSDAEIKPLVDVDKASYVIDPNKMGTMTKVSKWVYADKAKADAAAAGSAGAKVAGFEEALQLAYLDMAKDTLAIRKRRAEKRKKMMQQ